MENITNHIIINGFQTEYQCCENSFYVRFTDEDIEELAKYSYDMNYSLEPEIMTTDPQHPMRFKVISKSNPDRYGWISKVIEYKDDCWKVAFL